MPLGARSPLTDRILALATDEWQGMEDFMDRAIPLVPPGRALRVYQREAERQDAHRAKKIADGQRTAPRKPALSEAEQLRSGARAMVNGVLANAVENGWVETESVDGNRRNRRIRRSDARRFAHHCCLHGGTCRGEPGHGEPEPAVEVAPTLEVADDPALVALIDRVLASRAAREAGSWVKCPECDRQCRGTGGLVAHRRAKHEGLIREVNPGDIDRLLRSCG